MAEFAPAPGANRITSFSAYTNGDGIINGSASANTKGSYETCITSLPFDIEHLIVNIEPQSTNRDFLVDVAIGAAAAEQIILPNLLVSSSQYGPFELTHYHFPLAIPAGTRLSARCQSSTGSGSHELFMHGFANGLDGQAPCSRVEAWGVNTADSGATSIDPGASTGVMGAWSQLIASTAFDVKWIMVAIGNQANSGRTSMVGDVDIGIGAGGSEQVLVPSIRWYCRAEPDTFNPHTFGPIPVSIPAGTRIAARTINYSVNATPARLMDVAVYGIG